MKYKEQIIKLTKTTPTLLVTFTAPTDLLPDAQYNNIHSFAFYVASGPTVTGAQQIKKKTVINVYEIKQFKIGDFEVCGSETPLKIFNTGPGAALNERYTEVNIPNQHKSISLTLAQRIFGGPDATFNGEVYLVLRMNNVDPKEYFKNYFRYETFKRELTTSPFQVDRFSFRPKAGAKQLVGILPTFIHQYHVFSSPTVPGDIVEYAAVGKVARAVIGKLSLQLNNRKSNPVLMNCHDFTFESVQRTVDFMELDEPILRSSSIDGWLQQTDMITTSVGRLHFYLTCKYSIEL